MVPTLFGIMVVNFVIIQAAPGGPVELMIARIKGTRGRGDGAPGRRPGGDDGAAARGKRGPRRRGAPASTAARAGSIPS